MATTTGTSAKESSRSHDRLTPVEVREAFVPPCGRLSATIPTRHAIGRVRSDTSVLAAYSAAKPVARTSGAAREPPLPSVPGRPCRRRATLAFEVDRRSGGVAIGSDPDRQYSGFMYDRDTLGDTVDGTIGTRGRRVPGPEPPSDPRAHRDRSPDRSSFVSRRARRPAVTGSRAAARLRAFSGSDDSVAASSVRSRTRPALTGNAGL